MRLVPVALSERSYDIEIGAGLLASSGERITARKYATHAVVISDTNLEHLADVVAGSLAEHCNSVDLLYVEPGEPSKSIEVCDQLWNKLLELGTDRKSLIVAVGGGVVGDLAGFVAASFARGLAFVQIPTSLLAQVDSSVGGKVGINLPGAKNMVGAFWQPTFVLIDINVLHSLPDREYRAGLAEVVKYGVILDDEFFVYLEKHVDEINARDAQVLEQIVARSCELKALVVSQDEREETGLRAVLNYGHTFCHAIETLSGYGELLHGEAVSIGMLCASRLAERLGRITADVTQRQHALLTALQIPVDLPPLDPEQMIKVMARDKKAEHGKLRFVLPSKLGHVELVGGVPSEVVREVLIECRTS